jgi:SOS-response transcriptional repressor LexA
MILSPLNEQILISINRGDSIREMGRILELASTNAVAERITALEGGGYVLPPSRKGGRDRRLSKLGRNYLKGQGYIHE